MEKISRTKIVDLLKRRDFGAMVNVKGWVRTRRGSKQVNFIALNDGVDSNKPNETDSIFLPIKSLMDEMYAADTSKKIRAVIQAKARAGERVTVNPPYGYLKDPDNPKNWIIDQLPAKL